MRQKNTKNVQLVLKNSLTPGTITKNSMSQILRFAHAGRTGITFETGGSSLIDFVGLQKCPIRRKAGLLPYLFAGGVDPRGTPPFCSLFNSGRAEISLPEGYEMLL